MEGGLKKMLVLGLAGGGIHTDLCTRFLSGKKKKGCREERDGVEKATWMNGELPEDRIVREGGQLQQ